MNNTQLQQKIDLYNSQSKYNRNKVVKSAGIAIYLIEKFCIPASYKRFCRSVIIGDAETLDITNKLNPKVRTAIKFAGRYFRVKFLSGVQESDDKMISIRVFKVAPSIFETLNKYHQSLAVKEGNHYVFYLACVAPKKQEA